MNMVNTFLEQGHLPYLLDLGLRRMQSDLGRLVGEQTFPDLRGSHFRILSFIPAEGCRPTALALTAQMTKPAVGEIVAHLRDHGYVSVEADASDGRAVVVQLTARGRRAAAVANKAIAELKREWSREIGAERIEALVDALSMLARGGGEDAPR